MVAWNSPYRTRIRKIIGLAFQCCKFMCGARARTALAGASCIQTIRPKRNRLRQCAHVHGASPLASCGLAARTLMSPLPHFESVPLALYGSTTPDGALASSIAARAFANLALRVGAVRPLQCQR